MFAIIAKGTAALQPDTETHVINAGIRLVSDELRDMNAVLYKLSPLQRNRMKLALCEAIAAINVHEQMISSAPMVLPAPSRKERDDATMGGGGAMINLNTLGQPAARNAGYLREGGAAP